MYIIQSKHKNQQDLCILYVYFMFYAKKKPHKILYPSKNKRGRNIKKFCPNLGLWSFQVMEV
jgi:hypothetical protein